MNIDFERSDKAVFLKAIKGGESFHFATDTIHQAISEDAIYFVVSGGKDDRVQIANLSDGLLLQRDGSHKVIKLNTKMIVLAD